MNGGFKFTEKTAISVYFYQLYVSAFK